VFIEHLNAQDFGYLVFEICLPEFLLMIYKNLCILKLQDLCWSSALKIVSMLLWLVFLLFQGHLFKILFIYLFICLFIFLMGLRFELKAGALPLEPHIQSILLWLLWSWGLVNFLTGLALNYNPPDLSLPSS
jgi:hypothetical protein